MQHVAIETGYNPALVALSIAISIAASYTALDLGGRVRTVTSMPRAVWILGATIAMGGGIWAMHFVGMLAFEIAMPVRYEVGLTTLSLGIALLATGLAFIWVGRPRARLRDTLVSGPLMGIGIAAMHYTGMAAMRMSGDLAFSLPIVAVSVAIAVTAATAALWLTFRENALWQKLLAAIVMGVAVAGMHYTGMAAATVSHGGGAVPAADAVGVGQQNLALIVSGATFLILFIGLVGSSVEQQRVRRDLMASEERFRAAVEAVGDIVWTNDAEGRMVGAQRDWQRYTGQTQAECQGFGWSSAIHPDDVEPTLIAWRSAVAERRLAAFEHRVRRHDGVYRSFSVRAVPVLQAGGPIREWVGVHEDITDRRAFEDMLRTARDAAEAANVAKSTFLANMSHELRTPLSAIIGYSEMMAEEIADGCASSDLAADIGKVESNARHLLGLINDVLDLSKVESGKMEVFAETFEIDRTVRDLATTVSALVDKKGNIVELRLPPGLDSMHSDITKVRQMLLNLLSNAAKFTENGTITLGAERVVVAGRDHVRFRVSDTGIGMDGEQLTRLFQRFTQADASTTRRYGGTGLGLSLTKAFATMLGGTIDVESRPGAGTTFTVTLPADYEPGAAIDDEVDDVAHGGGGDLVLVIDDDADQRALMTRFLHREGFRARTAADGATGLAMARQLKPHAILLDVMMPGVDGWSVLSSLKADPDLSGIPVVMVTFSEQRSLATALGADDYVVKPVRWDRFKAVLDRYRPPARRVLVVEDDADTRHRIRRVLEKDGWTVADAANGQIGLDCLDSTSPDLILLDLTMPVMDGFAFLEALRARPDGAVIPVVVLTALDITSSDRRRLRGVSQILNKGDNSMRSLAERLHAVALSTSSTDMAAGQGEHRPLALTQ